MAPTKSIPALDVIDMDDSHWIVHALHNNAVALHQWMHPHEVASKMESRCSLTLASPFYMDTAHTPSPHLINSLRSAEVSTNTFVENHKYVNMVLSIPHYHDRVWDTLEATRHER